MPLLFKAQMLTQREAITEDPEDQIHIQTVAQEEAGGEAALLSQQVQEDPDSSTLTQIHNALHHQTII